MKKDTEKTARPKLDLLTLRRLQGVLRFLHLVANAWDIHKKAEYPHYCRDNNRTTQERTQAKE